jgi:hypothetical protein
MEYLITESQYHYLKQVLSEQTVYTDKKKYKKAMDIYNVQKMFYDYFTRNKKKENTSSGLYDSGESFKDSTIRFDVEYSTKGNESDYQKKLVGNTNLSNWINWPAYMIDFIYSSSIGQPHISDIYQKKIGFSQNSVPTFTKNDTDVYYKIFSDYKLKEIITSWRHDYGGWNKNLPNPWLPVVKPPIKPVYEEPVVATTATTSPVIEPIITTTTTTVIEPEKTIISEPFYDKNTERAVEQYCGVTFVGRKGAGTFDRIHSTKDGRFLADYDKSKSGEWNINRFCKR